jgi:hypothetical protein
MKFALLASLLASAAAFAPAPEAGRSATALNEFAKGLVGGENVEPMFIGKTGSRNFDPLGLTEVSSLRLSVCLSACLLLLLPPCY